MDSDGNCWSFNGSEIESRDVLDRPMQRPSVTFDPTSLYYDMTGNKLMFIFNHYEFNYGLPARNGTHRDVERLQEVFGRHGRFQIKLFDDLTHGNINKKLHEICEMDHRNTSCIAIVVLSHGEENGTVYAKDRKYPLSDVINPLLYEQGLAGKPKLFIIQACRGEGSDSGRRVEIDGRSSVIIPTHSECLLVRSCYEEKVSFRSEEGSWLMQSLCDIMDKYYYDSHILDMMTLVNHEVSKKISDTDVEKYHEKKQIPEVTFTLTKYLRFY